MTDGLLILSGDSNFVQQLRTQFAEQFRLVVGGSLEKARDRLKKEPVRAVLAHLSKSNLNGHTVQEFLQELRAATHEVPVYGVVDPDCPDEFRRQASEQMEECLPIPLDLDRLSCILQRGSVSPLLDMPERFSTYPHHILHGKTRSLVTFTPDLFEMLDELKVAAAHDVTVLLIGETGSGKTYLAKLIHELSERYQQRCLTVACGALPPDLIESELFGYVKGAFTGADRNKEGKFAAAAGGTLLLDEIDVLAPEQQAKLLRVIETGEYEPVGSNDTCVSDVRLIAASNVDLEDLVRQNRFRMDLFYRLNTLSFHLLPLHMRPLDIEFLARKFAAAHGLTHGIQLEHLEPEFLLALRQYRWPGNIRELENVIRRAVLYCRGGVLRVGDLPSSIRSDPAEKLAPVEKAEPQPCTLEERVDQDERRIIAESLRQHNDHRTRTAKELGISRVTLYNKMKKFGMLN